MVARMKICCVTVIVSISKLVSPVCLVFLAKEVGHYRPVHRGGSRGFDRTPLLAD